MEKPPLEYPYLVVANTKSIEHEGTYRLPEAQLDRFLFKIQVNYPSLDQEFQSSAGIIPVKVFKQSVKLVQYYLRAD